MEEHSKKFYDIQGYYNHKLWSKERVYNMVSRKVITATEYKEITGEEYSENTTDK